MLPGGDLHSFDSEHSASGIIGSHLKLALQCSAAVEAKREEATVLVECVGDGQEAEEGKSRSEVGAFDGVESGEVNSS